MTDIEQLEQAVLRAKARVERIRQMKPSDLTHLISADVSAAVRAADLHLKECKNALSMAQFRAITGSRPNIGE